MDGIESAVGGISAVGLHKLMPSKVSSFGREGVAYIKGGPTKSVYSKGSL